MTVDVARRLQSLYVPAGDGVRLAVDVWLPVERIAAGGAVGTVMRVTRYHRAAAPRYPGPDADTNAAAGDLFNRAGFALVVADARGTGASFGTRDGELSEREIRDYGELIDWVAAQPWSNGRVGMYGTSYEGQAAELTAGLGNPHLVAVAALFSPYDPYRELFYPGGCGTDGRYARWMYESQLKDGVAGAAGRLAALTGQPEESIALPSPVKPADGPDGVALLDAAIGEHQANTDAHALMERVPFRDDHVPGLDWTATAPASVPPGASPAVPMLIRAGWLDGGFAAGALARFTTRSSRQQVEIGPWGHGGGSFGDTLRVSGAMADEPLSTASQDRRLVAFFAGYLEGDRAAAGRSTLTFGILGTGDWQTLTRWPAGTTGTQRWHLGALGSLTREGGPGRDRDLSGRRLGVHRGDEPVAGHRPGQGARLPWPGAGRGCAADVHQRAAARRRPGARVPRRDAAPGHVGDRRCGVRVSRNRESRWRGQLPDRGLPSLPAPCGGRPGRSGGPRAAADLRAARRPSRDPGHADGPGRAAAACRRRDPRRAPGQGRHRRPRCLLLHQVRSG